MEAFPEAETAVEDIEPDETPEEGTTVANDVDADAEDES